MALKQLLQIFEVVKVEEVVDAEASGPVVEDVPVSEDGVGFAVVQMQRVQGMAMLLLLQVVRHREELVPVVAKRQESSNLLICPS